MTFICQYRPCSRAFTRFANASKRNHGKYCSLSCYAASCRADVDLRWLADLYAQGWSVPRIARETRLTPTIVRDRLLAAKVRLRDRGFRVKRCVECGARIQIGKRCQRPKPCALARLAELAREYRAEKAG